MCLCVLPWILMSLGSLLFFPFQNLRMLILYRILGSFICTLCREYANVCLVLLWTYFYISLLYQSAQAAKNKYHRLGSLKYKFISALWSESPRTRCQPVLFLVRALFLVCRWPPSHSVLAWPFLNVYVEKEKASSGLSPSSYVATNPIKIHHFKHYKFKKLARFHLFSKLYNHIHQIPKQHLKGKPKYYH